MIFATRFFTSFQPSRKTIVIVFTTNSPTQVKPKLTKATLDTERHTENQLTKSLQSTNKGTH